MAVAQIIWGFEWNWQQFFLKTFTMLKTEYFWETIALFTGLELGSISHSLSDWLSTEGKKRRKKRQILDRVVPRKK